MNIKTADCPKCPKSMIQTATGTLLTTNPPQIGMEWWCGCGHREPAPPADRALLSDQRLEWWHAVNRRLPEAQQRPWGKLW